MGLRGYQQDLINEVRQSYKEGCNAPCIVLGCGGGKSVITADIAKSTTDKGNRVLFLIHRQELKEQIENTFKKWGVDMSKCYVEMVQTVSRKLHKIHKPNLIITDENHHGVANTYKKIYEYFSDVKRLGVTATPQRLNGGGLGEVNDKLIIGVTTKWLIDNNYLAPYEYYAPPTASTDGLHTQAGDFNKKEVAERMNKPKIYGDAIAYYKKLCDGEKAVCYCSNIEHSKSMADMFNLSGVSAAHIDGETPKAERRQIVEQFRKGEILILCNVDLISEGFDVPDCKAAILLRPTKSLNLYIQQSMRCMRYQPNKVAIIIDHVGNVNRFGLPDMDREWSLEPKKKGARGEKATVMVRQCDECFFTHEPSPVCPNCGYKYPIKQRTIEEIKEAKLEKIKGVVIKYDTHKDCQSMAELYAYAEKKGYKKGWAYHQGKIMGLL